MLLYHEFSFRGAEAGVSAQAAGARAGRPPRKRALPRSVEFGGSAQTAKNRAAIRSIVPLVRIVHPPTKRSIARKSRPESSIRPFGSQ